MTILFAGGEDTSFYPIVGAFGGVGVNNATTYPVRANFPRANEVAYVFNGTIADPPYSRYQTPVFTAGNSIWYHAQVSVGNGGAGPSFANTANQVALLFRSPDGVARIALRGTGTSGQYKISTRNAAGTYTDLATASVNFTATGGVMQVDIHIDYSASPGGVTMYYNGVSVLNSIGDPRTDSATQLNQVELASINNLGVASAGTGWSEVIVADQDTRSMALWTMVPQAAGATQGWTPNTVGNINAPAINDANFISTSTNNTLSEWTMPTALPPGNWNVRAIVSNARVQTALSGPQHFDFLCRGVTTDSLAGAPQAPSPAQPFANFMYNWLINPRTGVAWTAADIAAGLQFGIESQA